MKKKENGMLKVVHFICLLPVITFGIISIVATGGGGGGDGDDDDDTFTYYRQEMRDFVRDISTYAKVIDPDFAIIPQNGQELLTADGEGTGTPVSTYITAIDGVGREDLYYGYDNDNEATPTVERDYMIEFLDVAEAQGVEVLVTDYCWTKSYVDNSYSWSNTKGYISFAADHRDLDNIPSYPAAPYNEHTGNVTSLSEAQNFLYLLDPSNFATKTDFLTALQGTNYDIILIDFEFDGTPLTSTDVTSLKTKDNGGSRLVISYMSIGEAEDYRYYWDSGWETTPPAWLAEENPYWPGNYKVRYWQQGWQDIIFGNDSSYLKKTLDAGFDGVYLDIIDAFEYFE